MKMILENKKKLLVVLGIIVLILVFLIIKGCNKKSLIYTSKTFKDSKLPYIDVNIKGVNEINNSLQDDFYYIKNMNNGSTMKYEYSKNGDILSLLVIEAEEEFEEDDKPALVEYITYNIDLKNKKILKNDDIYDLYNIDKDVTELSVLESLINQYSKDYNNGFITKSNCSLEQNKQLDDCNVNYYIEKYRRYYSVDDNLTLYVKDNKVYGYLNIYEQLPYTTKTNYSDIKIKYELN